MADHDARRDDDDAARSEDVRAVGLVLASAAEAWTRAVDERAETLLFPDIDLPMRWLALQTVATTPGLSAERLAALLVKAAREADRRTSWVEPDEDYEQRLTAGPTTCCGPQWPNWPHR